MIDIASLISPGSAPTQVGNSWNFDGGIASPDWARQQAESVDRYQDQSYESDESIGVLFGGFIGTTLDRTGLLLDIGCGLHPILPHYVKHLKLENYLGIEPLQARVERAFPCFTGVLAESIPLVDDCAAAAAFATSLDHIEDPKKAISEVLRVLKPGAPLYFWLGVHDPHLLAEAKTFGVVHNHSSGLRKFARIIAAPLEHLHLIRKMRSQADKLAKGIPLDHAHARYHTTTTIDAELASYGLKITRRVLVPGSASLFVEARAIS